MYVAQFEFSLSSAEYNYTCLLRTLSAIIFSKNRFLGLHFCHIWI